MFGLNSEWYFSRIDTSVCSEEKSLENQLKIDDI
ncbi:MAG: hypothetical protein ACI9AB_002397, partial [Urechidicola sp.]